MEGGAEMTRDIPVTTATVMAVFFGVAVQNVYLAFWVFMALILQTMVEAMVMQRQLNPRPKRLPERDPLLWEGDNG
jgi:hypothetical protein